MAYKIRITEHAKGDTQVAYDYYESKRTGLGEAFLGELLKQFDELSSTPSHYGYIDDQVINDLHQTKGGDRVVIPIHETVEAILQKYNGSTPPKISDQKLNDYVKELCQKAAITETMEIQSTKGGQRISEVLEKWQLISSHTARRSFATNMYKAGIPAHTIMKITGHKKESNFLKYIKLSESEHAEIMREHWQAAAKAKQPLNAA